MAVDQRPTRVSWWSPGCARQRGSVGELSRASGLSARVLRHWEDLGLLRADRSPNGHRRYGPAQVTRLYRALALRRTGLGLRQIAALLEEQDPDPVTTLRAMSPNSKRICAVAASCTTASQACSRLLRTPVSPTAARTRKPRY